MAWYVCAVTNEMIKYEMLCVWQTENANISKTPIWHYADDKPATEQIVCGRSHSYRITLFLGRSSFSFRCSVTFECVRFHFDFRLLNIEISFPSCPRFVTNAVLISVLSGEKQWINVKEFSWVEKGGKCDWTEIRFEIFLKWYDVLSSDVSGCDI